MKVLKKLLRMGAVEDERLPTVEILKRTPLDKLDEAVGRSRSSGRPRTFVRR